MDAIRDYYKKQGYSDEDIEKAISNIQTNKVKMEEKKNEPQKALTYEEMGNMTRESDKKFFKEPEAIRDLKHYYNQYRQEGWNAENVLSFLGDAFYATGQTISDTGENVGNNLGKGLAGIGEGIDDLKTHTYAQLADWAGQISKNENLRDYANELHEEASTQEGNWLTEMQNRVEATSDSSVLGTKGQQVIEGAGTSLPAIVVGSVSGGLGTLGAVLEQGTLGVLAMSSAGNSLNESYQTRGKVDGLAWLKAGLDAGATYLTEEMSGYLGHGATWDNKLATDINKYVKSSLGKSLVRYNLQAMAEGAEEVEEYLANKITNSFINTALSVKGEDGAKFEGIKSIKKEEAVENYIMGYLATLLTSAPIKLGSGVMQLRSNNYDLKKTVDSISQQEELAGQREIYEAELNKAEKTLKKEIKKAPTAGIKNFFEAKLNEIHQAQEEIKAPESKVDQAFKNVFNKVKQGFSVKQSVQENVVQQQTVQPEVQQEVQQEVQPEVQQEATEKINEVKEKNKPAEQQVEQTQIEEQPVEQQIEQKPEVQQIEEQQTEKPKAPVNYKKQALNLIDSSEYLSSIEKSQQKKTIREAYKDVEFNEEDFNNFQKEFENNNNKIFKAQYDSILDTSKTWEDGREKLWDKYRHRTKEYDKKAFNEALDIVKPNHQGRRTKEQWLNIAKHIGTNIADKSNFDIEEIAFRTFQEARPNQKENLNRQGNKYVKFSSDEWINTIYDAVQEQRKNQPVAEEITPKQQAPMPKAEKKAEPKVPQTQVVAQEVKQEKQTAVKKIPSQQKKVSSPKVAEKKITKKTKEKNTFVNVTNQKTEAKKITNKETPKAVPVAEKVKKQEKIQEQSKKSTATKKDTFNTEALDKQVQETIKEQPEKKSLKKAINKVKEKGLKVRKTLQSIATSETMPETAQDTAIDLIEKMGFEPDSNKSQLSRADSFIENNGYDKAYDRMMVGLENESFTYDKRGLAGLGKLKISEVDDVALGERLIQHFAETKELDKLQNVIVATAEAGTESGRIIQAMTLLKHSTPQGQAVWLQRSVDRMNKELAEQSGGYIIKNKDGSYKIENRYGKDITKKVKQFTVTKEMLDKITNSTQENLLENTEEVYKELGQQVPKSFIEKLDAWRYFSMLANPKTHIRNMLGNATMGNIAKLKTKVVAGAIEGAVSKVAPVFNKELERTTTIRPSSKEVKAFAKSDVKNEVVRDMLEIGSSKYEKPQSRIKDVQRTFKSEWAEEYVAGAFNKNMKLLELEDAGESEIKAIDSLFHIMSAGLAPNYEFALANYMTANKLTPENISKTQLNKARKYAVDYAKKATFHQYSAIANAINMFSSQSPYAKFLVDARVPFRRTPINVAKTGLAYSPLGLVRAITDIKALNQGKITGAQYIDHIAEGLTGTGLSIIGYALARANIIKASGGDDDEKEKYNQAQGLQQYSMKIGNKTYSLDWLSPAGVPVFIGAETYEIAQRRKKEDGVEEDKSLFTDILNGMTNIANASSKALNPMAEMTMISGLADMFETVSSKGNATEKLGDVILGTGSTYVNQLIPTALGHLAKTTDKYERTTTSTKTTGLGKTVDTTINSIKAKVPGLRQTLPVKTDSWGKEMTQPGNLPVRALNNFFNPAVVKNISSDSVDEGINELYKKTGDNAILPQSIQTTININDKTYRFSNQDFQKYKKEYGETSHELLEEMMKTKEYQGLNDEDKAKAISEVYSYAKEKIKQDYAKQKNQEVKQSSAYTTIDELKKAGASTKDISSYIAKYETIQPDYDKEGKAISGSLNNKRLDWLANSELSDNAKKIIYENRIGADANYDEYNGNINNYLKYKVDVYKLKGDKKSASSIDRVNAILDGGYSDTEMRQLYKAVGNDDSFSGYNGSTKTYLTFKVDSEKEKKKRTSDKDATVSQADKTNAIINGNYSNKERQQLYETYVSEKDYEYKAVKQANINMKEYLQYKQEDLKADRLDDGTLNGKAISGTAKAKKIAYINNMNITYEQKLLLMGSQFTLSSRERETVAHYINNLKLNQNDKLQLYNKMKGFTVYKNGRVTW